MPKYTPMIEQYLDIKKDYQDSILMFRLGDFYEMFFEDARLAARELEIVLTARDGGKTKIPMCGVPFHAVENYIARLINRGHRVAICEQMEDPRQATGIVRREVTRVITPGTVMDEHMLDEGRNNYLAALAEEKDHIGLAYVDLSTGGFWVSEFSGQEAASCIETELHRLGPAECLLPADSNSDNLFKDKLPGLGVLVTRVEDHSTALKDSTQILKKHFDVVSLEGYGLKDFTAGVKAAAILMEYLYTTQKTKPQHIHSISVCHCSDYLDLDAFTRRNLELTATIRENKKVGSLLGVLDKCCTSMGKRMIRKWLDQPLRNLETINHRLDAVEELLSNLSLREAIQEILGQVYDLERIAGKVGSGLANPRDLLALKYSAAQLPSLQEALSNCSSELIAGISHLDNLGDIYDLIDTAIDENAPAIIREGGIIKAGYQPEIDELRNLSSQGKDWLLDFELREKSRSGIKNLKVGYNKVFGYYIEISKSNLAMVPADYIRKQTLVNTERFITSELKDYEGKILGAREKLYGLEYDWFLKIRQQLEKYISVIQKTAHKVAILDVLLSLARVAYENDYVRPLLSQNGSIEIVSGRHPVVEKSLTDSYFIPNDVRLDLKDHRFAIITGPNMGGKSTYMRQVAILVVMAQMGSFIPAQEANIGLVDRIFTRVGAADDLSAGQSTFMVEMLEMAYILNHATRDSLIILDEIGRGTSTYDGLSIAQAVSEFINREIGAKTLFATHYHELTDLAESNPGIFNLSVSVLESGERVSFLKKVLPGKADKSYGIHVAQLAGLPRQVIGRAYEVLGELEESWDDPKESQLVQASLFTNDNSDILEELKSVDLDNVSPRQAWLLLCRWKEQIGN